MTDKEHAKIFLKVLCIDVKTKLKKVRKIKTLINQAGSSTHVSRNQTSQDEFIEEEVIESWFPFRSSCSEDNQQNPLLRKMESSTKFSRVIKSLLNTLVACYDGPIQDDGGGVSLSSCELFTTKEVPAGGTYHFDDLEGDAFDLETVALIDHQCTAADLGITVSDHGDPSTSLTLLMKFHSTPTYLNDSLVCSASPSVTTSAPTGTMSDVIPVVPSQPQRIHDKQHLTSHDRNPSSRSDPVVPKVVASHTPVPNSVMRNSRGNSSFSRDGDLPSTTALGPMRDKLRRQQLSAPHEMSVRHLEPWPSVSYGRSPAPVHFHNASFVSVRRPPPKAAPCTVGSADRIRQSHTNHSLNQSHNSREDDHADEISMLRMRLVEEKRRRHLAEMEVLNVYTNSPPRVKTVHRHEEAVVDEPAADIDEIALREHRLLMDRLKIQRPSRSAARN